MRPTSLKDALALLVENSGAHPVAGGTDLLLDLQRSGRNSPGNSPTDGAGTPPAPVTLIDLTAITGFSSILETDDSFLLGGGVTHNQIVADPRVQAAALPLAQACLEIGSPQLRNRATVAGNLITASPANDSISALMALGAEVVLERLELNTGAGGNASEATVVRRRMPVSQFITGFRSTQCRPDELLTEIHVPKLQDGERGIWVKLGLRKAQAISVVHAGLVIGRDSSGQVTKAQLALGSVAPTVVMIDALSDLLVGHALTDELIIEAGRVAAASVSPIDDGRATAEYRTATISMLVERSLRALSNDEQGDQWLDQPVCLASSDRPPAEPSDPTEPRPAPAGSDLADGPITVMVNDAVITAPGATLTLLDWLRDQSDDLSGTKEGCAEGECGACTVIIDGAAAMSCLVLAGQCDAASVVTVEGLRQSDGRMHPIQSSFVDEFAVQCGYCIPGFLVAGAALLDEHPEPSDEQIRLGLSGNLCRCTGYYPIIEAIQSAGQVST